MINILCLTHSVQKKRRINHLGRIMKLSVFLFFCFAFAAMAEHANSQNAKVTLNKQGAAISEILNDIEEQTDYLFLYNKKNVNVSRTVSVHATDKSVATVLSELFEGTPISYEMSGKHIVLTAKERKRLPEREQHKERTITGVVTDKKGEPIIGANVFAKGTTIGSITDLDGKFSLVMPDNAILFISYIGYKSYECVVGTKTNFPVILEEDSETIEEVVVTALGIKRSEKGLGYSVQKIDGEKLSMVKNVDVASSLIGKVAGMNIQSSTEFNEAPELTLRGEKPILVLDGVPYTNISLRDLASDDIESISVLKGATASALYGSRGGDGAIIVTTKKGNKKGGLQVNISSNTMFEAGYIAFPEVQTAYSSGGSGTYRVGDFVWGAPLDAGYTASQYNPLTYEWEERELVSKGKDNFENFLETGLVTNNNINLSFQGEKGSFRTSLTHVYNKGQYPNTKLNKFTYSVGGDFKVDKFSFEGNLTYNKRFYPNDKGTKYGSGGYIYNLIVWSGSEYDIRDYRNYWIPGKEGEQQNWMENNWYDNPYFLANEVRHNDDYDVTNGSLSMKYDMFAWLNVTLRSGFDYYQDKEEWKYAKSYTMQKKGYYYVDQENAFSMNHDLLIAANHKFGKLGVDGLVGGTINYKQGSSVWGETNNGLSIADFYSLNASIDPAKTGQKGSRKQVNSIFAKATFSWESMLFIDVTARNDWSSTLPSTTRSFFYPSVAASLVLSEFIKMPDWLSLLKVRGSWTQNKKDLEIYDINNTYSIKTNLWNSLTAAYYPEIIRGIDLMPESSRSYELGVNANFLKNRIWVDVTYYNKRRYDFAVKAPLSMSSGYKETFVNSKEEKERRGFEVTVGGTPVKTKNFQWNTLINWSSDRDVYVKIDPKYSSKAPWVKEGNRADHLTTTLWDTDSNGNMVHGANGLPESIPYKGLMGYSSPNWIWGFSNTFKYKNLSLDVSLDGCVGGVAYNWTDQAMWNSGAHIESDNQWRHDEVVDKKINYVGQGVKVVSGQIERDEYGQVIADHRVYAPNDTKVSYENYIRTYSNDYYAGKPQSFKSRTYLKLREVALNYTLPESLTQKVGMNNFTIGLTGNNLLLWTKDFKYSDPDKGKDELNSPSMRYIGFNLRTSF